ncbi:MAG: hypothetical protein ABIU87_04675 [Ornithinibacter sp.]
MASAAEPGVLEGGTPAPPTGVEELRSSLLRAIGTTARALGMAQRSSSPLLPKVTAEAALLVHVVECAGAPATGAAVEEATAALRTRVRHEVGDPVLAARIALNPVHVADLASAYVLLTRGPSWACAHGTATRRADVDRALRDAWAVTADRESLPHRVLERCWLAHLLGLPPRLRTERAALHLSALGSPADVLAGSRLDAYAFTHSVMYATHLGTRRCPPVRRAHEVCSDAESLLAGAVAARDMDLAGELLLVWPQMGAPMPAAARCAFTVLAAQERRHGTLPSLAHDGSDPDRAAATSYHAAVVWGILAASLLRLGVPVPTWAPSRADLRLHRQLTALLGDRGPVLDVRLAMGAALRMAVARADAAPLEALLHLAQAHGVGDLAAARQSLDLVLRLGELGRAQQRAECVPA